MNNKIERHFITVPQGTVHCAICGSGEPVLFLHQTPRSWDEFRDVLPLIGKKRRAIGMDTIGFGDSSRLADGEHSVERWAEVAFALLDALKIERAAIVGHHTGGYVATEMAAAQPQRVSALVLSSVGVTTKEERLKHATGRAVVDDVDYTLDGAHLLALWQGRASFYPHDIDLLNRFMIDCLKAGSLAGEGHRVVARYPMEERLPTLKCPVQFIAAPEDPHAYPDVAKLRAALPSATVVEIAGGMVPLPDQMPGPFAVAVESFLQAVADKLS